MRSKKERELENGERTKKRKKGRKKSKTSERKSFECGSRCIEFAIDEFERITIDYCEKTATVRITYLGRV
jgi:hypothetical protein